MNTITVYGLECAKRNWVPAWLFSIVKYSIFLQPFRFFFTKPAYGTGKIV